MKKYSMSSKFLTSFYVNGIEVMQRSSDNYINITHVTMQIISVRRSFGQGWTSVHFAKYLLLYNSQDYIKELYRTGVLNDDTPPWKFNGKKSNQSQRWVHPLLFVDYFAHTGYENRAALYQYMIRK